MPQVTISYLGRPQLAPVSARVQALDSMYGFECSCERCLAEAESYEKVSCCWGCPFLVPCLGIWQATLQQHCLSDHLPV
jgi:hypothetical protein